jgi:hypothetical protein
VQELQPLIERFVQWQEIPGLAIGIVEHNQLVNERMPRWTSHSA